MSRRRVSHEIGLLDALTSLSEQRFTGQIWRVVHGSRSPLDGSKGAGRWNIRESEVLYCAMEKDGALSEIDFHMRRGQSVFPSKLKSWSYELSAYFEKVLDLSDLELLKRLGVETKHYHEMVYAKTQMIGEAVGWLGFEAMIVPNARHPSNNLVIFPQNIDPDALEELGKHRVNWTTWRS